MNSTLEHTILESLGNDLLSVNELAKKMGMNRQKLTGYLELLVEQGKLKKSTVGMAHVFQKAD